jgi:hypothetical protein
MLAFAALAVYVGRTLAPFIAEAASRLLARRKGSSGGGFSDDAEYLVAGVFLLVMIGQGIMLVRNVVDVGPVIAARVAAGRATERAVNYVVQKTVATGAQDRRVWIGEEPYAELAGLMLMEMHGFKLERLDRSPVPLVGLRTFDAPLPVYTDALPYDDAVFRAYNEFPNPGFEADSPGLPLAEGARSGKRSLVARCGATPRSCALDSAPFVLRPGTVCVFGGFLRLDARASAAVRMALRSVEGTAYEKLTPALRQTQPEWELVWECAAPPAGSKRFIFRAIQADELRDGAIYADDLFLCPVEPLIALRRNGLR